MNGEIFKNFTVQISPIVLELVIYSSAHHRKKSQPHVNEIPISDINNNNNPKLFQKSKIPWKKKWDLNKRLKCVSLLGERLSISKWTHHSGTNTTHSIIPMSLDGANERRKKNKKKWNKSVNESMWTQFQVFDYITVFVVAHLFTYMWCAAQLIIAQLNCCRGVDSCRCYTRRIFCLYFVDSCFASPLWGKHIAAHLFAWPFRCVKTSSTTAKPNTAREREPTGNNQPWWSEQEEEVKKSPSPSSKLNELKASHFAYFFFFSALSQQQQQQKRKDRKKTSRFSPSIQSQILLFLLEASSLFSWPRFLM